MHGRAPRALLSLLVVVVLFGSAWLARAQLGGASGITIPYAGQLQLDGEPVSGSVTFIVEVFSDEATPDACFTSPGIITPVLAGAFSLVVTGVPEGCVADKEVYLGVQVDQGGGPIALGGRQRVHPGLGALTSGGGDFAVAGSLKAASGSGLYVGHVGVGSGDEFLGVARGNRRNGSDYALLQASNGTTFVNSATGLPLYLRTGNVDRAVLRPDGRLDVTGAINAGASGGNVPHACVVRASTGSYNVACAAGEVAVGGGGRCSSHWRLTESLPWGGASDANFPSPGSPARGWRAVCQVWGDAGNYTPPQNGTYAICCRQ